MNHRLIQQHHFGSSKRRMLVRLVPTTALFVLVVVAFWKPSPCTVLLWEQVIMARAGEGSNPQPAYPQENVVLSPRRMNVNETLAGLDKKQGNAKSPLDFIIVGFPKCGTTSLLTTLRQHAEIAMPPQEFYLLRNATATHEEIREQLDQVFGEESPTLRRGLKDPNEVYRNFPALRRIQAMTASGDRPATTTRVVVALRHPVELLESYYNYRVKEWYEPSWMTGQGPIPPLENLMKEEEGDRWAGVHAKYLQMERYLAPLLDLQETFPIFLLHLHQLKSHQDDCLERGLQQFLGLKEPVAPFVATNTHEEKDQEYPEELDICQSRHDDLRQTLVQRGNTTSAWLLEHFLPRVQHVQSQELQEWIRQFGTDPCGK